MPKRKLFATLHTTIRGRKRHREDGVTAVLTAICATLLVGSMAFAVDIGNAMQVQRKAQNAADSASFAGLQRYSDVMRSGTTEDRAMTEALMEAQTYAEQNFPSVKWKDCTATKPLGFRNLDVELHRYRTSGYQSVGSFADAHCYPQRHKVNVRRGVRKRFDQHQERCCL
jgi:Flp pilus assembly protein TadG